MPGDSAPVAITITVGDGPGSFAYQDGDQPFVLVTPTGGVVTFTVTATRYAFARKCNAGSTRLFYKAASETSATFGSCSVAAPNPNKITGTLVSAADAAHYFEHGVASTFVFTDAGETTSPYELATSGSADFIAARQLGGDAADRLHVERDLAVSGTVTRDLTFAGLEVPSLTTQPIPQDAGSVYTYLLTATSTALFDDFEAPYSFVALPGGARRATDRYLTSVSVNLAETSTVTVDRIVDLPQPFTSLPSTNLLAAPTVAGATVTWNRVPGLDGTLLLVSTASPALGIAAFSADWSALDEMQRFEVPDLSKVAGWPDSGGFRGALDSLDIFVTLENKPYPDPGYESTSYQRSYGSSQLRSRRREGSRAIQALVHAEAR